MTNIEMMWLLLFLIGIGLAIAVLASRQIPWLKAGMAKVFVGVVAAAFLVFGGIYGVVPLLPEEEVPVVTIADGIAAVVYPEFDITPTANTASGYNPDTTINSAKTMFTVPAKKNTTGNNICELDGTTWENPRFNFSIVPVPFAGADADDLATCYYTSSNYDAYVYASDQSYRLITKTSGEFQVIWTDEDSNVAYVDGSITNLMTASETITLDFTVNTGGMGRMDINDPIDITLTFYNGDWSWSKSYTVSFEVQQSTTTSCP